MPLSDAIRLERHKNKDRSIDVRLKAANGHPVTIRGGTTDIHCFDQIFSKWEYTCPFPIDAKVIVDAGANTGLSALYFASVYPEATILALEPEIANFRLLKRNCAFIDRIRPLHGALWPRPGTVSLTESFDGGAWAFTVEREAKVSLDTVTAYTVQDLIRISGALRIDILKLDIEGSEKALFDGDTEWLNCVGLIIIETHDRFLSGCSRSVYRKLVERSFHQEIRGENIFILLDQG